MEIRAATCFRVVCLEEDDDKSRVASEMGGWGGLSDPSTALKPACTFWLLWGVHSPEFSPAVGRQKHSTSVILTLACAIQTYSGAAL